MPRNAPLFWCQAGISYVALDLPGFEAPVTKFVFHFRSSTTPKTLTQLTCCRVLMPGRCEALLQSHVVSTCFNIWFLMVSLKIPISNNALVATRYPKSLRSFEVHTLNISPTPTRLKHAFDLALGECFTMLRFASCIFLLIRAIWSLGWGQF